MIGWRVVCERPATDTGPESWAGCSLREAYDIFGRFSAPGVDWRGWAFYAETAR